MTKFLLAIEEKNSANLSVLKWGEMLPLTENSACGLKWVFNDAIFKNGIRRHIVPHYWHHVFPSRFQVPKFQVFVTTRANNPHKSRVKVIDWKDNWWSWLIIRVLSYTNRNTVQHWSFFVCFCTLKGLRPFAQAVWGVCSGDNWWDRWI